MIMIIKAFISCLFYYLTYLFLEKFEKLKCECAYDIRKDLLKNMLLTFYVLIFAKIVFKNEIPDRLCTLLYFIYYHLI